jgi:hypothetical protein
MRMAAMVLGIVGGIFGLFSAVLALGIGGIGQNVGSEGAGLTTTLGALAFVWSLLALLGAGLALNKPRLAAGLLLVAGIATIISISFFAILAAPLELLAA